MAMDFKKNGGTPYGVTAAGEAVEQHVLRNKNGLEVRCIGYGCRLTHILVPGRGGAVDVLLGYDDLAGYEADAGCQGALVGRYAGRIKGAAFMLGGESYTLPQNDGHNYLHGSLQHKAFLGEQAGENAVAFSHISPDGEDGFPGELWVGVSYTLTEDNELVMDLRARTDADTYLNLTNHAYFNLAGEGDVLDQELWLNSEEFLEVDDALIPTGRLLPAAGAFNFGQPKPIGRDLKADDVQLRRGGGYDHTFLLRRAQGVSLGRAAHLIAPDHSRSLTLFTTQPAVQLYTGNSLDGRPGKGGVPLAQHSGLCLEAQHCPDSPHHPDFPSTLLKAGERFRAITVLKFDW